MIKPGFIIPVWVTAYLLCLSTVVIAAGSRPEVPKIQPDTLNQMLHDPDLVIIDVRDPVSWEKSALKISGAVREDYKQVEKWASSYSVNKTIVFY